MAFCAKDKKMSGGKEMMKRNAIALNRGSCPFIQLVIKVALCLLSKIISGVGSLLKKKVERMNELVVGINKRWGWQSSGSGRAIFFFQYFKVLSANKVTKPFLCGLMVTMD